MLSTHSTHQLLCKPEWGRPGRVKNKDEYSHQFLNDMYFLPWKKHHSLRELLTLRSILFTAVCQLSFSPSQHLTLSRATKKLLRWPQWKTPPWKDFRFSSTSWHYIKTKVGASLKYKGHMESQWSATKKFDATSVWTGRACWHPAVIRCGLMNTCAGCCVSI